MKISTAIGLIKNIHFTVKNEAEEIECAKTQQAFKLAIEALEKQLPKKPEQSTYYHRMTGDENDIYVCPECDSFLAYKSDADCDESYQPTHCSGCGQKIDWGADDED